MRNIFTALVLVCCFGLTMNAQTLATFEDGANDVLAIDPDYWYDGERFIEGGRPAIASNSAKTGLNTSDKCLVAINVADADWWGNFIGLNLTEPVTITESNRYLHFLAYRSIQPKNFRIGFNDREEANEVFQGKLKADAVWEGVVCDLGSKFMGQELKTITIIFSCNWGDPRTGWGVATYMFDNFELSDSPIPPGTTLLDGSKLSIGFESASELDKWVHEIDLLNEHNQGAIVDNPFLDEVNATGKAYRFDKSNEASWWQGARFDFNGIMPVGNANPQYLHVMVRVPGEVFSEEDLQGIDIQLCSKDHMSVESNDVFTVWDDEADQWMDLVLDINKINYLKELTVRFDVRKDADGNWVNSPANTYYIDAIAFNNDPEPRTVVTGIKNPAIRSQARIIGVSDAIQIAVDGKAGVAVYNVLGGLIQSANINGNFNLPVNKGVYVVKIKTAGGEQVSKVLVR